MTNSIHYIFEHNIKLIGDMDRAVLYFRQQHYDRALGILTNSIDRIKIVIEAIITNREYFHLVATDSMLEMLAGILKANKNRDFTLLADLLELQLISFLIGVQELIISKEEIIFNEDNYKENILLLFEHGEGFPLQLQEPINTTKLLESGYRVEFTSCGQMTLAAENGQSEFYFHSNSKVQQEAYLLARSWYRTDKKRYVIYGVGMGYHLGELLNIDEEIELEVYEADLSVIQLACAFAAVKSLLQSKRFSLIYDQDFTQIKRRISELHADEIFHVHYPSYKNIRCREGKELLNHAFPWARAIEDCE